MFLRLSSMIRTVLVGCLREALRQNKYKGRTFAGNACDANRPAVQLCEALGKREPEAGAFGLAQMVTARLTEFLEHERQLVGGDADAGVDDGDLRRDARVAIRYRQQASAQRHAATRGGELDGVREQVDDDLLDLALVGHPFAQRVVHFQSEAQVVPAGALAHQCQRVLEQLSEIEARQLQFHAAGLNLRQVEDVVDQCQQMVPGRVYVAQIIELFGVQLAEHFVDQYLGETDDRIKWRAQLMRHVGEELRLV